MLRFAGPWTNDDRVFIPCPRPVRPRLTPSFLQIWIFYQLTQFLQGKKDARLYRRYGPAGDLRDFVVAELLVDPELKDCFLFRW